MPRGRTSRVRDPQTLQHQRRSTVGFPHAWGNATTHAWSLAPLHAAPHEEAGGNATSPRIRRWHVPCSRSKSAGPSGCKKTSCKPRGDGAPVRLSDSHHLSSLARREFQRPLVISLTLALVAGIACADFLFADVDLISHLYYLPILLAATQLGRPTAIAVAAAAVLLTHLGDPDLARFRYGEADVMELVLFVTVAVVASGWSQTERELRRLASTDDLTGLHNLRSFEAIARDLIERQRRAHGAVAVVCLDADRLKQLNDTYGHLTGADAVRHIGKVIADVLPEGASACRFDVVVFEGRRLIWLRDAFREDGS